MGRVEEGGWREDCAGREWLGTDWDSEELVGRIDRELWLAVVSPLTGWRNRRCTFFIIPLGAGVDSPSVVACWLDRAPPNPSLPATTACVCG